MPLIKCPDCETDVSDRAPNCIKCGYPIKELIQNEVIDTELEKVVAQIKTDKSFNIGSQRVNWAGNAALKKITANIEPGDLGHIESGQMLFFMHKEGIRIRNGLLSPSKYDIHFRQIIDITEKNAEEMVEENKSVIGRGLAGGVLLGPAGAIVGALSAMKTNSLKKLTIIKLSFCEPNLFERKDIYFRVPRGTATPFVLKAQQEISKIRPDYMDKFQQRTIEYVERISPKHADRVRAELKAKQNSLDKNK